jgi:hypothetical protein
MRLLRQEENRLRKCSIFLHRHCEQREAIQDASGISRSGLPRRFSPRNDELDGALIKETTR